MTNYDEFQQRFINFDLPHGDVLMLEATPGSGKSTSIVGRISKKEPDPSKVIVTTFSNKSASDIRKKLKSNGITSTIVGTTHKIMIDLYKKYVGSIQIIPEWDSIKILRDIITSSMSFSSKKEATRFTREIMNLIQFYNSSHFNTSIYDFSINDTFDGDVSISDEKFIKFYTEYDKKKREMNVYDFDDLLSKRLYSQLPINIINRDYDSIYIDEAQDMNLSNFEVIKKVFFNNMSQIFVFDTAQQLYHFRWATTEPLVNDHFWTPKSVYRLTLQNNYRSGGNIVKVFNKYRQLFDPLDAIPHKKEEKGQVKFIKLASDIQAGTYIANEIKTLLSSGYSSRDITVLVRKSRFIKTVLEPSFIRLNIPYNVYTPTQKREFYHIPINKFYLNLVDYKFNGDITKVYDVVDLLIGIGVSFKERLLKNPNVSDVKMQKINEIVSYIDSVKAESPKDIITVIDVVTKIVYKYMKPDLYSEKTISIISKTITNFIKSLMEEEGVLDIESIMYEMFQKIHEYDSENSDKVTLTTVHQYKGGENNIVFVTDMNDTSFKIDPSTLPVMYVALSRAKDKMYLVEYETMSTFKMGLVKTKPYPKIEELKKKLSK